MAQGTVGVNILSNVVELGGTNVGAFGDIIAVSPTPQVQLDFVYGINSQTGFSAVANGGVVDTNASRLRLSTSTNAAGDAAFESLRSSRYRPGEGMDARFTAAWEGSAADSTQVVGAGNVNDGYFFGFDGITFGVLLRKGAADSWTAQSAWNGDRCDGTGASGFIWDKTKGNVMMIRYPYLGYGNIKFYVQNPATSGWILCHTIRYTNSSALVQVNNPSFPFFAQNVNTGNTTDLISYVGSVYMAVTGEQKYLGAQWATDNAKTVTTENVLFSIRNCTTYNGVTNTGRIRLRSISAAYPNNSNAYAVVRLKKNSTIGGAPSFATINGTTGDNGVTITSGNSIVSVDTAGTTVTGGAYIWQGTMCQAGNLYADLSSFDIFVSPGEILTVSGFASNSASVAAGLNWEEDV
jgi:hypothetical protein